MGEEQFQIARALGFLLAALLAVGLERLSPHRGVAGSWRPNLGLWAVNLIVMAVVCGACACTVARWAAERGIGLLNAIEVSPWIAILLTVVMLDLVSYAWHRANHVVPFLWRFHRVHHSDARFTVSTGVRFHPGELVLSLPLRLVAVLSLGAPVAGILLFELVFAVANLIVHGDIDYPRWLEKPLGRVLVTPALHRRHHGKDPALLGTNFGTIFSLWDRALGTYGESSSAARIETGLHHVLGDLRLDRLLRLPFAPSGMPAQPR